MWVDADTLNVPGPGPQEGMPPAGVSIGARTGDLTRSCEIVTNELFHCAPVRRAWPSRP